MRALHQRRPGIAVRMFASGILLACLVARQAEAHKGPPFPLFMDQPAAEYSVSVWADPDIGDAYFYIVVETPSGQPPEQVPKVLMWTEPISGRLAKETWEAPRVDLRNRVQFEVRPYFDQGDMWNVGFRIEPPGGTADELVAQVESTPPGLGPWDFAIYLFPFLLMGGMWVLAIVRRRRATRIVEPESTEAPSEPLDRQPTLVAANSKDCT